MELVDGVSLLQRLNLSTSGRVAGRWPKYVLARVTSFLSPVDVIECRIMCTSKRWRAIISEILPSLWQLHKEKLSPVRVQLELVDHDYLNRNRGLLLAMERWVQEIERSEESVIQGFFSEFSAKDQFWQQLFFYLKTCFYLSRNQNMIVAQRFNLEATKNGG